MGTVTTDRNGRVFLSLENGSYYAVETESAEGFHMVLPVLREDVVFEVVPIFLLPSACVFNQADSDPNPL